MPEIDSRGYRAPASRYLRAMPRRLVALPVVTSVVLGCAGLFHKPRPDTDLPLAERPARVRCEWVLPRAADPGAPPGPAVSGWVWASDAKERRLVLEGRLVDAMFVVSSVKAASDEDDRDIVPVGSTAAEVAELCRASIARREENAGAELVRVRAAREGEDVPVPIVYADDPKRPRPVSRVVVIGDSLSDDGNLKRRLKVFPSSPYWLGRFSNGPSWADHLETRTRMSVQNLAYGGAVARRHDNVPYEELVTRISQGGQFFVSGSLEGQVRDYLERDLRNGAMQEPRDTVFVIWGGANDYLVKEPFTGDVETMLDTPEGEAGYRRIAEETVASLGEQVRRLYAAGGRRFVVVNLPNLGITPMVVHNKSYRAREVEASDPAAEQARRLELAMKLGALSLYHNRRLEREIGALRRELPGVGIIAVNAANAMGLMLERRSPSGEDVAFDYGFDLSAGEVVLRDDERQLRVQDRCYAGSYLGSEDASQVCDGAETRVFWDMVHPSSLTHCWIAYFVQDGFARAGWATAPSLEPHRDYCLQQVASDRPGNESAPGP